MTWHTDDHLGLDIEQLKVVQSPHTYIALSELLSWVKFAVIGSDSLNCVLCLSSAQFPSASAASAMRPSP